MGICYGLGGGGARRSCEKNVSHLHFKWLQFCTLLYLCDFPYPLSYEPILALMLNTDLYVFVINYFGWQILCSYDTDTDTRELECKLSFLAVTLELPGGSSRLFLAKGWFIFHCCTSCFLPEK